MKRFKNKGTLALCLLVACLFCASAGLAEEPVEEYGYTLEDVAYSWDEPSEAEAVDLLVDADDGVLGPWSIGFPFSFFGNWYESFYVSPNGWVGFGGDQKVSTAGCAKQGLQAPNNMIAAFGGDRAVYATDGGHILYHLMETEYGDASVISFINVRTEFDDPSSLATFQVVLWDRTGDVEVRWKTVPADPGDVAVGIENEDGTQLIGAGSCPASIQSETAVRFLYPRRTILRPLETHQTAVGGTDAAVSFELINRAGESGTFGLQYTSMDWEVNGPAEVGPLLAGEKTTVEVQVSVPPDADYLETRAIRASVQSPVKSDEDNPRIDLTATCAFPWQTLSNMPWRLADMAVADDSDGLVHIIGGITRDHPGGTTTHWIIDPFDPGELWPEGRRLPVILREISAVRMGSQILIPGGAGGDVVTSNLYIYDLEDATWSEGARSPAAVTGYAAARFETSLVRAGGQTEAGQVLAETYVYDPATETWSVGPSMNESRHMHTVLECDGVLYAMGGLDEQGHLLDSVETLEALEDAWDQSLVPPLPNAGHSMAGTCYGGLVFIAGGTINQEGVFTTSDAVYIYDPSTSEWIHGPVLPEARTSGGFSLQALAFFGGLQQDGQTTAKDVYQLRGPWPVLDSVEPEELSIHSSLQMEGSFFEEGASVQLHHDILPDVTLESVVLTNSHSLQASVPPQILPGLYDLVVTNPDGQSTTLAGAVTVNSEDDVVEEVDSTNRSTGCGCDITGGY